MRHTIDLSAARRNLPDIKEIAGMAASRNSVVLDLVGLPPMARVTVSMSNPDGKEHGMEWFADPEGRATVQLQPSGVVGLGTYDIRIVRQESLTGDAEAIGRGWIDYAQAKMSPRAES